MDGPNPIASDGLPLGPEPPRLTVEDLLDEGVWVRALASRLVGGREHDADDIAQDTFVAALEKAPRDPLHRRSWLARVATNFARLKRRGDAHRAQREMQASRSEGQPSASETVERLEAQRVLVDALRALDEPYRTTVMRRYFDGLSAADIARAENVPAATVRWRLMHGIEELRQKLDARYGDRRTWSIAFIPLVRPHPALVGAAAAGGATLTGVLVMNALTRTAVVAALVLSGSLGVWLVVRPNEPLSPPVTQPATSEAELATPPRAERVAEDLAASTPAEVRAALPASTVAAPPSNAAATTAHIDGRFVDASGRAIAGVRIVDPPGPDQKPVVGNEHGAFDLEIPRSPPRGTMHFEAQCAGWATFYGSCAPRPGETQHMGNIVLEPGGAIAGIVLSPDGAPARNVTVVAIDPQLDADVDSERRCGPDQAREAQAADRFRMPWTKSASDGSFRLEGVPAKLVRAWAHKEGMRWSFSDPIEVAAASVRPGIVLKLEALSPDDRIEGVVVDPDGKPIPRAMVMYNCSLVGNSWSSGIQAGDDGRFRILVTRKVAHGLQVEDRESRWPEVSLEDVQPGTLDVVLRFRVPRLIDLTVVDQHGNPLDAYEAEVCSPDTYQTYWRAPSKPRAEGRVSVPVPDKQFVIQASAPGHDKQKTAVFEPTATPGQVQLVLQTLPGLRGRVVAAGKPVSGATVMLHEYVSKEMRADMNGWLTQLHPNRLVRETTDEEGRFELTVRKAGRYAILYEAGGFARGELSGLEVDPKVGADDIELVLGHGGTLEGRVLVPEGRDAGGVIVGITRYDNYPLTMRTASDGAFRFEGLTPGSWKVQRIARDQDPTSGGTSFSFVKEPIVFETNCLVEEGRTTRFDLDLRKAFDVVFAGHVSVNGAAAAGWTVTLWPGDSEATSGDLPGGTVDERGNVRITMAVPEKVRVYLTSAKEGQVALTISEVVELRAGENPWVLDLDTGVVEGHVAGGPGTSVRYEWLDGGKMKGGMRCLADANGRFRMPHVPCGRGRLINEGNGPAPEASSADAGREPIVVKKGETTSVELQ